MITIKGIEIKRNPFLRQHFNLTHQALLFQYDREHYNLLKAQADSLNKVQEAKDKDRKSEEFKKELERKNAERQRKRRIARAKAKAQGRGT